MLAISPRNEVAIRMPEAILRPRWHRVHRREWRRSGRQACPQGSTMRAERDGRAKKGPGSKKPELVDQLEAEARAPMEKAGGMDHGLPKEEGTAGQAPEAAG